MCFVGVLVCRMFHSFPHFSIPSESLSWLSPQASCVCLGMADFKLSTASFGSLAFLQSRKLEVFYKVHCVLCTEMTRRTVWFIIPQLEPDNLTSRVKWFKLKETNLTFGARFYIPTVALVKSEVFQNVTPCGLINHYRRFGRSILSSLSFRLFNPEDECSNKPRHDRHCLLINKE